MCCFMLTLFSFDLSGSCGLNAVHARGGQSYVLSLTTLFFFLSVSIYLGSVKRNASLVNNLLGFEANGIKKKKSLKRIKVNDF